MLILITPDIIKEEHYEVLRESLHYVDRLHIKLNDTVYHESFENEVKQIIQRITPSENGPLRKKITIHINEELLNKLIQSDSSKSISNDTIFNILGLNNIHLSEKLYHKYRSIIDKIFYHQYVVTTSIHHLGIYEEYNHFSYLIYGPVFESISKTNYLPEKTIAELKNDIQQINEEIGISIVAVGGITINNFKEALNAGFSGIALRGYIWQNNHPLQTLNQFVEEWKRYKGQ